MREMGRKWWRCRECRFLCGICVVELEIEVVVGMAVRTIAVLCMESLSWLYHVLFILKLQQK